MANDKSIPPHEAKALIERHRGNPGVVLIDVRTPAEYGRGHIKGAQNIDTNIFPQQMGSLDTGSTYLLYCASGVRSRRIRQLMEKSGFPHVYDLAGGYTAWQRSSVE